MILVPQATTFVPVTNSTVTPPDVPDDSPDVVDPEIRRPFWKDPVIVIGAAFPILLLSAFGFYLYRESRIKSDRGRILAVKAEADGKYTQDPEVAHDKYSRLAESTGGWAASDPDVKRTLDMARKSRDQLVAVIEERRLAREASEARRLALREAVDKATREKERLEKVRVSVRGGAWLEKKAGQSDLLRGLRISVIPATMRKSQLTWPFARMHQVGSIPEKLRIQFKELADEDEVDLKRISAMLRLPIIDQKAEDEVAYQYMVDDKLWPLLISSIEVLGSVTDIEGKYAIRDLPGGSYYLVGRYWNAFSYIEWMIPIAADKEQDIRQDLHNATALIIQNKND